MEDTSWPPRRWVLSFLEKGVKMAQKKDAHGNWIHTLGVTVPAPVVASLSAEKVTKTVASIRKWLKTGPAKKAVESVVAYEKAHENRVSAVGKDGCLTNYLSGE